MYVTCDDGLSGPERRVRLTGSRAARPAGRAPSQDGEVAAQRPRTTFMPCRICTRCFGAKRPTRSSRKDRSMVMIREAFATESLGRLVALAESLVLPGASAQVICSSAECTSRPRSGSDSARPPEPPPPALESGPRTGGVWQLRPPDFTLRDLYHSLRSSTRRADPVTNGSGSGSPIRSRTRFMASVASSGAWRARYSDNASA